MSIEKAPAGAWTGKLVTGETRGSVDVIPPNHKDARCGQGAASARPEEPFGQPGKWSDGTFAADDFRAGHLRVAISIRVRNLAAGPDTRAPVIPS